MVIWGGGHTVDFEIAVPPYSKKREVVLVPSLSRLCPKNRYGAKVGVLLPEVLVQRLSMKVLIAGHVPVALAVTEETGEDAKVAGVCRCAQGHLGNLGAS